MASTRTYFSSLYLWIPLVFIGLAGILPFATIVVSSFSAWDSSGDLSRWGSVEGYFEATQSFRLKQLRVILLRASAIASLDLLLGIPIAYLLVRSVSPRMRNLYLFSLTLPFFTSQVTRAFCWQFVLGTKGFTNQMLQYLGLISRPLDNLMFNEFSVGLALVAGSVSFCVFPITITLLGIPESIWLASEGFSVKRVNELFRVAIPLSWTGIVTGWVAAFILNLGASVEIDMLGGASKISLAQMISDLESAQKWSVEYALTTLIFCFLSVLALVGFFAARSRKS